MRTTTLLSVGLLSLVACGGDPAVFGLSGPPGEGGGDEGGAGATTASTSAGGQGGGAGGASTTTGPGSGGVGAGGGGICASGQLACDGDELVVCDGRGGVELVEDCAASASSCVVDACEKALRLRLRFEEGGGSQLFDDAEGHVGQLNAITGSVAWVPGYAGQALDMAPSVEGAFGDVLNDLSFSVTIAAWIYVDPSASTNMVVVATDVSPTTPYAGFWLSINPATGNTVAVGFGNGQGTGPSNRHGKETWEGFPSGVWTHVAAAVYGHQMASIWINGVFVDGSYSGSATTVAFTQAPLVVGRGSWAQSDQAFNGAIDDLRIYDRALTPTEIGELAAK